ncbi:UNVERIFIED_CONTAM: hypothetical protein GTU68_059845 [Idotea baltica]|nr:hypothetical protein [Idotea baltica]
MLCCKGMRGWCVVLVVARSILERKCYPSRAKAETGASRQQRARLRRRSSSMPPGLGRIKSRHLQALSRLVLFPSVARRLCYQRPKARMSTGGLLSGHWMKAGTRSPKAES